MSKPESPIPFHISPVYFPPRTLFSPLSLPVVSPSAASPLLHRLLSFQPLGFAFKSSEAIRSLSPSLPRREETRSSPLPRLAKMVGAPELGIVRRGCCSFERKVRPYSDRERGFFCRKVPGISTSAPHIPPHEGLQRTSPFFESRSLSVD